jgi:outer membrane protein assembly factor BamB
VVYVGCGDHNVYAFNATTGSKIWNFTMGNGSDSGPAVVDGVVYFGSTDTKVYAIDANTGAQVWNFTTGDIIDSSPSVANGVVYIGSRDNRVYAIDANTGAQVWNFTTGAGIWSSPAVANGVVYMGSSDAKIYAISANTGAQVWNFTTGNSIIPSPAVANGVVYIGSSDNKTYAIDASTGAEVWNFTTAGYVVSSPAVANGVVYFGSSDNKTYAIDASTGAEVWNFTTGNKVWSSPAVANGTVYIGSYDNRVYAIDANTGDQVWNFTTGSSVHSSPAIANGVVYVGSEDKTFYALGGTLAVHADYAVNISYGVKPLAVAFTDLSRGLQITTNLSFGDGNWTNSTGTWVHTYTSEGTFFPVIYAWNSTGSDSRTNATISVGVFPGLDRDVAMGYNLVLQKVLGGSIGRRAAFASPKKVKARFWLNQWGSEAARCVTAPDTDQYFYYINLFPWHNEESLGQFVFADLDTNSVTVHYTWTPPENLDTIQIAGETGGGGEVKALNSVTGQPFGSSGPHALGAQASSTSCSDVDCRHCHALLISGGYNRDMNRYSYYDDIATMYYILNTTYCYPPENITVLLSDGTDPAEDIYAYLDFDTTPPTPVYRNSDPDLNGDGVSEVNGPATRENVLNNLTSLRDTLTEQDNLFIFTTNHGGNDTVPGSNEARLWLWNKEYVWDHEFMKAMEGIRAKNITMVMEQCFGGGFIDDFAASPTRVIATAANADESSVRDDFSYAWQLGVWYGWADTEYEGNRDGFTSLWEAFDYANWTDYSASVGDEHPQYSSMAQNAGETLGLGSCSRTKCLAPSTILPGGQGLPADPDGDCVYEDLNGDGTFNLADVVFFFNNLGWITDPANGQAIGPFDVNQNGKVDFSDIVDLYWDPSCPDCLKP